MGLESATEIARDVSAGRRRAADVVQAALAAVEALDPCVHAFLEVHGERAMARAAQIDRAVAAGSAPGPLAGVPIAVKDNICTRAGHTTCASRILQGYRSPYDATVIERIEAAGGIVLGKTNLDEFAMGSSTENSGRVTSRNPWNPDRVPGGSSGGSAVAVACGMTPLALGSDTGGSIRQPASLCGIVGLKPTYGRVSRYGLVAYGSSLDQIGPLSLSVVDAALLLTVMAGHDERDSTSIDRAPEDFVGALRDEPVTARLRGLRIGIPREYFGDGLDDDVRHAVLEAVGVLERGGARRVDISMPHSPYCVAVYYLVATAEASSNLARYDGVHYGHRTAAPRDIFDLYSSSRNEGFGPEVKRRIMLGTFALSSGYYDAYYTKALKVRRLIRGDFDRAFEQVDVICCPASPTPAFRIGEKCDDPLAMYLADIYTIAANLAGVPGLVVPCGSSRAGLPIGLQVLGGPLSETTLLQVGRAFERATDWHARRPPLAA